MDLSPSELADRLASTQTYTAEDLGGDSFRSLEGKRSKKVRVILVSTETRDAIIQALRDWK